MCLIWCLCVWCPKTPSSVFWKELALAMPRRVVFHKESAGDPQTLLQDDRDPMLTLEPDYLDCRSDTDPAGDLGKSCTHLQKLSVFKNKKNPEPLVYKIPNTNR